MKTVTQELLTMLQEHHDGCSLYALHNILGVSTANIYQFSKGQYEMSADTLLIACDILGLDPRPWLIRVELTRCKSPKRRQILERILASLDSPESRAAVGFLAFFVVGFFVGY